MLGKFSLRNFDTFGNLEAVGTNEVPYCLWYFAWLKPCKILLLLRKPFQKLKLLNVTVNNLDG